MIRARTTILDLLVHNDIVMCQVNRSRATAFARPRTSRGLGGSDARDRHEARALRGCLTPSSPPPAVRRAAPPRPVPTRSAARRREDAWCWCATARADPKRANAQMAVPREELKQTKTAFLASNKQNEKFSNKQTNKQTNVDAVLHDSVGTLAASRPRGQKTKCDLV